MAIIHLKEGIHIIDAEFQGRRGFLSTYVLIGERAMVIDPGFTTTVNEVIEDLERLGVDGKTLALVAPTHIHLDHAGGSWRLLEQYPDARLYVHPRGARHMKNPAQLEAASRQLLGDFIDSYGPIRGVSHDRVIESEDGEIIDLGGVKVQTVWTPGHSSHHQCYFLPDDGIVMLGDAGGLYSPDAETVIPTTPPPFNPPRAIESLEKLMALKPKAVCYSHFGLVNNGVEMLDSYRRKILLWSRIVEQGLDDGMERGEIYGRIREEDPVVRQVEKLHVDELDSLLQIDLLGFIKYFEWAKNRTRGNQ